MKIMQIDSGKWDNFTLLCEIRDPWTFYPGTANYVASYAQGLDCWGFETQGNDPSVIKWYVGISLCTAVTDVCNDVADC